MAGLKIDSQMRVYLLVPLALVVLVLLYAEYTTLDVRISSLFYDQQTGTWPFRHDFWVEKVAHKWGKNLILLTGVTNLVLFSLSWWVRALFPYRRKTLFFFLAIGLSTGIVGIIKASSFTHCPWDLDLYGGDVPYVGLLQANPAGLSRGGCWPGGHASGGFALLALFFIFKENSNKWAIAGLVFGLVMGNLYGVIQVMRGAHFLSHHLWSGILVWFICLGLYQFGFKARLNMRQEPG